MNMWPENDKEIENILKDKLKNHTETVDTTNYQAQYNSVRDYMNQHIYPNIIATEPSLSDHSEKHIVNVLVNAGKLISYDNYSAMELYALCTAILIHDTGNIHGRDEHRHSIRDTYMKKFSDIEQTEKRIISKIAIAHGGDENDPDAISTLNREHIGGEPIDCQTIAAIVRFADELAEGPQRASQYFLKNNMLDEISSIYHYYANILTSLEIATNSVNLKYCIYLDSYNKDQLEKLLLLMYKRIYKLNRERIYCGMFNKEIAKLSKTKITIQFFKNKNDFNHINLDSVRDKIIFDLDNLSCNEIAEEEIQERYLNALLRELER